MSMWRRKRRQEQTTVPETLSELIRRKLGLWGIPVRIAGAVIHRTLFGFSLLVSTFAGRLVGAVGAGALLLDAGFGSDPVALPVSIWAVLLAALVFGVFFYSRRRRWEEHVESIIWDVVPGHSGLVPAVVWFPPKPFRFLQLGRWAGTWSIGFRVPGKLKESQREEITTQLRSRLPAARGSSWMVDYDLRRGTATATLKEDMPDTLTREELLLRVENEGGGDRDKIPLGVSVDGVEYFDVEKDPHTLAVGKTGKGKSVAQLGVVCHALESEFWELVACDPKRVELNYLRGYPSVRTVERDLKGITTAIVGAADEMQQRYNEMEAAGYNHIRDYDPNAKRLLVVVDELAQVTMPSDQKDEESKAKDEMRKAAMRALEDIASLGRAAGVHLYVSTQRPDVQLKILSGPLKHNLTGRLACGQMDATASGMALDSDAAAQLPAEPKGRAIWQSVDGEKQIQVAFTKPSDLPAKKEVAA